MELWRKNLYASWIAEMITITGFNFIMPFMPFMPFYVQELGITDVGQVARWPGILTGVPALVMAIFSPIWGSLADIYGRKIMVERAMFGGAFTFFLMALATNVYQLLFYRILQAALTGTVAACIGRLSDKYGCKKLLIIYYSWSRNLLSSPGFCQQYFSACCIKDFIRSFLWGHPPTANTIISLSTSPYDRGKAFGVTTSATCLGNTLGPLAGGLVASTLSLKAVFIFTSIVLILTRIWIIIAVKKPKKIEY